MKKVSRQSKQEIRQAYSRQVMSGLVRMRKALTWLRQGSNSRLNLAEIQRAAKAISDLAMIHGFQGVESISRKIYTAIREHPSRLATSPPFLSKIHEALQGIEKVVALEGRRESVMTVEKVDSAEAPGNPDQLDDDKRHVVVVENDTGLAFDINENEFLMHLGDGVPSKA